MSISTQLKSLTGKWKGTNKLWLDPAAPAKESESELEISLAINGRFTRLVYGWAYEGETQEGLLLVGSAGQAFQVQAIWMDSWHMQDGFMVCEGSMVPNGGFSVKGTYAAPPGPDWGWRIALALQDTETLQLSMYNITPDGQESLAVETIYRRISQAS
jgi:hypothetical protein